MHGPIDTNTTAAVAVTMEVDTGVDAPTSTILIFAPLAAGATIAKRD